MRKCSKCLKELHLDKFSKNASRKDGLNERCKDCCNQYIREHYKKNKQYYKNKAKESDKRQTERNKKIIKDIKEKSCCIKCGESHPATLDFHHINQNEKEFTIAAGLSKSLKSLKKEIDKCIVLCSNCHRKLHWKENKT